MYCRFGFPEEVLTDLGTQFTADCMKEVAKLMSIKQLTTSPYHPMCNGLAKKFNGTLKKILKRLCSEQLCQWHRYINALLFAYCQVPKFQQVSHHLSYCMDGRYVKPCEVCVLFQVV